MQRCPYIHEMRERLLGPQNQTAINMESMMERDGLIDNRQSDNQVGTVVKLNADGYGSHTSPAHQRTPLVPRDLGEDFSLDNDDEPYDPRKPKNAKTSLFIITSLVYAMLLIVVCIAYVISDVSTHQLPVLYYEGFFTYLYGASILFLLYVFCFLLQESTCCSGGKPKPPKEKKPKKQKPKKPDPVDGKDSKSGTKDAPGPGKDTKDSVKGEKNKPSPFQDTAVNVEVAEPVATPKAMRKRKTTQNDQVHGSFFLRVGAIAFGLGTMIYVGLEFGTFFEIPFTSQCHQILRGVNPLLQMIFTFMQMYFIFMNSRLNIHRFKVLARFGLMHICATNICVWIRTLVLESLKEITVYHQGRAPKREDNAILETIRQHSLRHAGTVMGTHVGPDNDWEMVNTSDKHPAPGSNLLSRIVQSTVRAITDATEATTMGYDNYMRRFSTTTSTTRPTTSTTTSTTTHRPSTTPSYNSYFNNGFQYRNHDATIHDDDSSSPMRKMIKKIITSSTSTSTTSTSTSTSTTTTTTPQTTSLFDIITDDYISTTSTPSTAGTTAESRSLSSSSNPLSAFFATFTTPSTTTSTTSESSVLNLYENFEPVFQKISHLSLDISNPEYHQESYENFDNIYPAALIASDITSNSTSCGRVNIMGSIVQDSAPYLYPFIIEYSLIGAVVIYVMWKHIGRYPKYTEEDLEHRLEIMLSRRAVAMAQAHSGRVDCVGASKGLFFGLLLLVGSLICLILFFVLVRHPHFSLLAIYLADVSHCALMGFAVFAIFVGFIRVQTLKFRCEDQSNLNDILLRISAFGLFIYSIFSVIAGSLNAMVSEPNLLVMITGILAVAQVVFQLLFIADVSRRRVHLPEHDRSKPARQIVTFLLICNIAMFAIYTFEAQKVFANPVQLDFYGFIAWSLIQRVTLPLCIFHRFHSAVTLAEIWKTTYKARLE